MKILFLSDGIAPFSIGGMQKYSSDMVKCLIRKDCEVTLVFCVNKNQKIPTFEEIVLALELEPRRSNLLKVHGLHFPEISKRPGHYIKESYQYSMEAFNLIKDKLDDFDFIYAQGFSGWYTLEQKRKMNFKAPIGVHFHGLNMFQKIFGAKNKLKSFFFKKPVSRNLEMADVVFSYGGKLNSVYKNLKVDHKLMFQPIGIEKNKILTQVSPNHSPLRCVFIGRNDKVKGLDLLQKVISSLPIRAIEFTFIGDIPEKERLIRKDCTYTGVINDIDLNKHLVGSDILLCPSLSEGMPYVILEAMANGLVVIASDVGAISEMVDETNGILITPNDFDSLRNSILSLNEFSNEQLLKMKASSLKKAELFDWEIIIENTLSQFKELIEKNKRN